MEQGSTTTEAADTGLFAGEAWFDPIEAGIRERVRRFVEPRGSPDIQDLLEQELTASLGRGKSERAAGEPKGYRNGTRRRQLLGSFGPVEIEAPRARMAATDGGTTEWRSAALPRYAVVEHLDSQVAGLDKVIAARAKASATCKRLMTVPGVGPLVALTYAAGVDDPARFSDSRTVGAHFGLTPRRFQSGETDWYGGISRAGDAGGAAGIVSGSQRADPPQPRLVRPEVLGRAHRQAPGPEQGQGRAGAQAGRGAAQDVDDG